MKQEFWRGIFGGCFLVVVGSLLIALPHIDTDETKFPSGPWPIYLLGGMCLAGGVAAALYVTRIGTVAITGFVAIVLTLSSPLLFCVTYGGGGWRGGIPFIPDVANQFIGNALGTIFGIGLGIGAAYFWMQLFHEIRHEMMRKRR